VKWSIFYNEDVKFLDYRVGGKQMKFEYTPLVEWYCQKIAKVLREKTRPRATFSTINPTRTNLESNPRVRGGLRANNSLGFGTAFLSTKWDKEVSVLQYLN